jgi:hypothetical protein
MTTQAAPEIESSLTRRGWILAWLLLLAFVLVLYVPYAINGGFSIDDWGVIKVDHDHPGFWDCYRAWFPLFSNRPLAPAVLTVLSKVYRDNPLPYIVTNLLCLFLAMGFFCLAVRRQLGGVFCLLFMFLGSVPAISSAVIFSPVMQSTATVSVLLWALSLWITVRAAQTGRYSFWGYVPLLMGMLIYEIILPLMVMTVLLPMIVRPPLTAQATQPTLKRNLLRYALPPAAVLLAVAVLQKVIMPHFMEVYSRLNFTSLRAVLGLASWSFACTVGQAWIYVASVPQILTAESGKYHILVLLALAVTLRGLLSKAGPYPNPQRRNWLWVLVLAVLACSMLFVLSGSPANFSGGYKTRGLTSTWLTWSMLLAFLASQYQRRWPLAAVLLVGLFSANAFLVQRDNYIVSWRLQNQVRNSLDTKARELQVPRGAVVFGDVPGYVGGRLNFAEVFLAPWDWGASASLRTAGVFADGIPLTSQMIKDGEIERKDSIVVFSNYWEGDLSKSWFFQFNPSTNRGTLRKIEGPQDWDRLMQDLAQQTLNRRDPLVEDDMKKLIPYQSRSTPRRTTPLSR